MSFEDGKRRTRFVISPSAAKLASIAEAPSQNVTSSTTKNPPSTKVIREEARPLLKPENAVGGGGEIRARALDKIDGISSEALYRVCFHVSLGCNKGVKVAQKKLATSSKNTQGALLWNLSGPNAWKEVAMVQSIKHENFVKYLAVYGANDDFTVAFEFIPISLSEVVVNRRLEEPELACILKQVVNGLLYLEQQDWGHSKLTCSNVLIDHRGHIKIWGQQHCSQHSSHNLSAGFCLLTAQLIAGRERVDPDEFSFGIWTPPTDVADFFELTKELKNSTKDVEAGPRVNFMPRQNHMERVSRHPLLAKACEPHSLEMFLEFVRYSTRWLVRYSEATNVN